MTGVCFECGNPLKKRVFKDYTGNEFCSSDCKWESVFRADCSQNGKRPVVPGAWQWAERKAFDRDNWKCQHCGKGFHDKSPSGDSTYLEAHHKIPISKNGNSLPENLITLCHDCHMKPGMHRGTRSRTVLRSKKVDFTIQRSLS